MNKKISIKLVNINTLLFSILLFSTMLYVFDSTKYIGLFLLVATLILSPLYFIIHLNQIKVTRLLVIWTIYFAYGIIIVVNDFSIFDVETFSKHILMLFFVTVFSQASINKKRLEVLSKYFTWIYYIIIFLVIINEYIIDIIWIKQFLYKMGIMCLFFIILRTKKVYLYSFITIIALFITSTRSAILSIILFLLIYKWLNIVMKSKKLYSLTFWLCILLIITFPFIYVNLYMTEIGTILNNYSRMIFNKNFFSGRHYIWNIAFSYISESFLFGHGFSNNLVVNSGIVASTHNLFINLMLQGGIILLIIFLIFMYAIWMSYYKYLGNEVVKLSAAFLLPLLLRAGFDLILLENDLLISLYLWIPVIIGMMFSRYLSKLQYQKSMVYKKDNYTNIL